MRVVGVLWVVSAGFVVGSCSVRVIVFWCDLFVDSFSSMWCDPSRLGVFFAWCFVGCVEKSAFQLRGAGIRWLRLSCSVKLCTCSLRTFVCNVSPWSRRSQGAKVLCFGQDGFDAS